MRVLRSVFLLMVCFLSCSFIEGALLEKKIYLDEESLVVAGNQLCLCVNEYLIIPDTVYQDEKGFFIYDTGWFKDLIRGEKKCPNCRHHNPDVLERCAYCNHCLLRRGCD